MVHFSILGSGSSGNAGLVEEDGFGLLIDAGLGPRQLAVRLEKVASSWERIRAVLLTHTHSDHWNERTFQHLERLEIRVYCHARHRERLGEESPAFAALAEKGLVHQYQTHEEFSLTPNLRFRPIPLQHDDGITCGFRFERETAHPDRPCSLAYAADLGAWSGDLVRDLSNVDLLALEFNHDVKMEMSSGRSPFLISRILGDGGHLSNEQAAGLVKEIVRNSEPGRLQHLVQLHLSRDCNHPRLAQAAALAALAGHPSTQVHTARHDRPGPSLNIGGNGKNRWNGKTLVSHRQSCFPGWE